ncbi:hypothetical protein E2C01_084335 [Portunus trituberculatus]|uniref:Uncharacterized protein n=1 Tax=Portunus trituberculatus TaxID=210409 RepID=A0A5B7IY02_PORTR|nr:hypothetical protein [Portunus trituberculatus]
MNGLLLVPRLPSVVSPLPPFLSLPCILPPSSHLSKPFSPTLHMQHHFTSSPSLPPFPSSTSPPTVPFIPAISTLPL